MLCFVEYKITEEEIMALKSLDLQPIVVPKTNLVYPSIDGHVDIQLNIVSKKDKTVIVQKDISKSFLEYLSNKKVNFILSSKSLGYCYPEDIALNGVVTDSYFIHNLKHTDPTLLKTQEDKILINVNQGYSKCSLLPINDAFITSDKGIYAKLMEYDVDTLYVPPNDILLPGLNHGFIGGVGGMISKNKIAFFGSLDSFDFGQEVYKFLYKRDVEPIYLKKGKLIDRGSLLSL